MIKNKKLIIVLNSFPMVMNNKKVIAFEYLVKCLLKWKSEELKIPIYKAFLSKTQVLKLLFLTSAIQTSEGEDLLNVFNRFYAMQFGPVEGDIYAALAEKGFREIVVKDFSLYLSEPNDIDAIVDNYGLKKQIDTSVTLLRSANSKLIVLSATELVDITHKWWCWKKAFLNAQMFNKGSYLMTISSIRQSNKTFA